MCVLLYMSLRGWGVFYFSALEGSCFPSGDLRLLTVFVMLRFEFVCRQQLVFTFMCVMGCMCVLFYMHLVGR